jgi:hypothetical protein
MAVSLLSERMVLTPQGDANRNWLLAQDKLYDAIQPHIVFAPLISGVWMFCSYATATNKHDIKKSLNRWFKRLIDVKGFKPISTKQSQPEEHNFTKKPVAVVAIDVFRSTHAMFRWYSPIIRELKKDYQLVLVSRPDDVDNTSISLFDRFVPVSNDVESLQEVLDSCSPDLVYYPSIGMRPWAIALANLRWAPLQIMTLGHPATSHIDTIDAVILDSDLYTKSTVFSENQLILATKGGTLADNLIDLNLEELQGDRRTAKTNSLRIAIPCISMKINSEFIRALKAIKQQSPINIQYTFFPNEAGLTYMAIKKRLLLNFPNATIEQRVT